MRQNALLLAAFLAGSLSAACAAVYPELRTPTHAPAGGQVLDPPPASLKWISVEGATIPKLTRDGRSWGALGSQEPSSYAVVFVNGAELLRTKVESKTFNPTWPGSPEGNFILEEGDRLRVELWESRPMNDRPIGVRELTYAGELTDEHELAVSLDGGATLTLKIEPARPLVGLGFRYELRGEGSVYVTRVDEQSPAGRAGVRKGDRIVGIDGKPTKGMSTGEIQTLLNMQHPAGFQLQLGRADGAMVTLTLKEGAIYSLYGE